MVCPRPGADSLPTRRGRCLYFSLGSVRRGWHHKIRRRPRVRRRFPPMLRLTLACLVSTALCGSTSLRAEEPKADLREDAKKALKTAATFYRTKVASHGGYVYYYTPDLKERWGEGAASVDTI